MATFLQGTTSLASSVKRKAALAFDNAVTGINALGICFSLLSTTNWLETPNLPKKDINGRSAMDYAAYNGNVECVRVLLDLQVETKYSQKHCLANTHNLLNHSHEESPYNCLIYAACRGLLSSSISSRLNLTVSIIQENTNVQNY